MSSSCEIWHQHNITNIKNLFRRFREWNKQNIRKLSNWHKENIINLDIWHKQNMIKLSNWHKENISKFARFLQKNNLVSENNHENEYLDQPNIIQTYYSRSSVSHRNIQ
jgi:hypothetical protein